MTRTRRPCDDAARAGGVAEDGFTLLELVVVMGLVAVLTGLGVGFLRRDDTALDRAATALRAELRRAALGARAHGVPTELLHRPGRDGRPGELRARILVPLATWHLEPGELPPDPGLRPDLAGSDEPAGRFGHARRPDPEAGGEAAPLFSVRCGPALPLAAGFVLRLDLALERAVPMAVLRIGDGLDLELRADLVPELRMVQDAGGTRGGTARLEGRRPVPLHRWFTLEVLHDRRELALRVDGDEVRAPAPGPLLQRPGDRLEVSPAVAPIAGAVDEIALYAYRQSEPQVLPAAVELRGWPERVSFGRRGELPAPLSVELDDGERRLRLRVDRGGVVR